MPSGMPDSSPSMAGLKTGKSSVAKIGQDPMARKATGDSNNTGTKNSDGRVKGDGWDNFHSPFGGQDGVSNFNDQNVDSMPNEGMPLIINNGTKGLGEVI